jgi:fumarate hydratase class II
MTPPALPARTERDSLGPVEIPAGALYGASTARALINFPISGERMPRPLLRALGLIKWAAARANHKLGLLDADRAKLIEKAALEVADGTHDDHFAVDVFQTGSGTSTNMNANEVIANRCALIAGKPPGGHDPVHPNDHVNLGQSSNDVFPSAIHIAAAESLRNDLLPALGRLRDALVERGSAFDGVVKIGRTHLMDATPVRLGQVFGGYARQVTLGTQRAARAIQALAELPLGGTAVGTGINTHPRFAAEVITDLRVRTGLPFREAADHFEAQSARDGLVEASGLLRTVAISLHKIANDIRWLASGPRCGLGELRLPALQPGSSIMPGKVNPVLPEALLQVCARVVGADAAVAWAGANGNLELNTYMPLMAHELLGAIRLLATATDRFAECCVSGIQANPERCAELVERSHALVTALVPAIGYDRAAALAKQSAETGRTLRELALEAKLLPPDQLDVLLDPRSMTGI